MTRISLQPDRCRARNGTSRCDRPTHTSGPHRTELTDDHGHPTGRIQSWTDRWTAA